MSQFRIRGVCVSRYVSAFWFVYIGASAVTDAAVRGRGVTLHRRTALCILQQMNYQPRHEMLNAAHLQRVRERCVNIASAGRRDIDMIGLSLYF